MKINLGKTLRRLKINAKIRKCKFLHLMFNDKFNAPFVDFLNRNFNPGEHLILCKRIFNNIEFPKGNNVIEVKDFKKLNFAPAKKIICHSLFDQEIINLLYEKQELLEKSAWAIWGGDLYNVQRDVKNDFIRENFKEYLGDIDREYLLKMYQAKDNFHRVFYNFPITKEMLENTMKESHETLNIQVNNSCDASTIEMLNILSKFKNENIRVKTVLSYGEMEFKDEIIKLGKQIFNDKFEYIDKLLPPEDYAKYIAENNILILNQNRQQGFGNTLANLKSGKKVFIRKNVTVNKYLNNDGIKIYNSDEIKDMDFNTFKTYEERESNIKGVEKFFDEKYLTSLWKDFFDNISLIDFKKMPIKQQIATRKWRNSKHVAKYFQIKHIDKNTHKNWINNINSENSDTIAYFITKDFKPIGVTYFRKIDNIEKAADWGIYIHSKIERGKGIGTNVLKQSIKIAKNMGLERINLEVLKHNDRAIKLYESFNFKKIKEKNNVLSYTLNL